MPDDLLLLGIIAKNTDIDLVAQTLAFQKFRSLNMDAQVVQTLVNIGHCAPPLRKTVERRKQTFIVIASDGILENWMQIHRVQLGRTDRIQILVLYQNPGKDLL